MNPRERTLAIIIGAALGVVGLYNVVNIFFIKPVRDAEQKISELQSEDREIDLKFAAREMMARRWMKYVGQTFSYDSTDAMDRFGVELKEIAKRHGFDRATFQTGSGTNIGAKSGIKTVAHRIGVDGSYANVLAFLRDIYNTPYMCQITRLNLTPMDAKAGRNMVKLDVMVETPILPQIDKNKIPELANARTMTAESETALPPFREHLAGEQIYQVFNERNIFRAYEPPPTNIVMLENQDWKDVVASVVFYWDNKVTSEQIKAVPSKGNLSIEGKGDVAEIQGKYADGQVFGPKRFEFATKKDWAYQIAAHHPPPPPEVIDLAVDNQSPGTIQLDVKVTTKDNKQKTEPTMVFASGRADVREYRDVQNITVTAKYASGKQTAPQTFTPSNNKQTYNIPIEPPEAVVNAQPQPVEDSAPDPAYTVTGLLTYEDTQEMIATSGSDRKVIKAGEEGAVDGGTLLAVHPLGGVVLMPTGNYYIYPLGRKFTQRVRLAAGSEVELAAAIDAWTRE